MRRLIRVIGVQALAVALAVLQWQIGVRTDEAKYLLNIPYPHPPAARFVMSLTKGWECQELFWRLVFATLMLQAAWLVWDLARDLSRNQRAIVATSWILSSAVLLQAGTVMMAPLTALQALVLLWISSRPKLPERYPALIGFFWLATVFTAYQSVLFAPVAWYALRRRTLVERCVYVGVPLLLLCAYTFFNPLSATSFGVHGARQVSEGIGTRALETLRIWLLGGGIVLGITGLMGLVRSRRWDLLLSFLLVTAYVALSRYDYYAILFTPLLVVGLHRFFDPDCKTAPWFERHVWTALFVAGCWTMLWFHPLPPQSVARETMRSLSLSHIDLILIDGSYGHEWQYESPAVVRRFTQSLLSQARAIICLDVCLAFDKTGWRSIPAPVQTWVRQ